VNQIIDPSHYFSSRNEAFSGDRVTTLMMEAETLSEMLDDTSVLTTPEKTSLHSVAANDENLTFFSLSVLIICFNKSYSVLHKGAGLAQAV
jgi:hypothetical protein